MSCSYGETACSVCGGRGGEYRTMHGAGVVWAYCPGCRSGKVTCPQCGGSCRVTCMGCYGQSYSTITFEAKITAQVDVAHAYVGEDTDGAGAHMMKLPLDGLLKQSNLSPIQAEQFSGGVRFRLAAETPYRCRTYHIDPWTFDICAVGRENLIPDMPPIMDRVLEDITAKILSEKDPARVHALTSDSAFTRDILRAICGLDGYDLASVSRRYENSMSSGLLDKVNAAVKRGYDGVAGVRGRKVWVRGAVASNLGLVWLYKVGALSALVKLAGQPPTDTTAQMAGLVLLAAALLAITWTWARSSALREARRLFSSGVKNCPGMGWAPGAAMLATCATLVCLLSAMQTPPIASRNWAPIPVAHNAGANAPGTAVMSPR